MVAAIRGPSDGIWPMIFAMTVLPVAEAGFTFNFPFWNNLTAQALYRWKQIFSLIKYFAFAGDNGYTMFETWRNVDAPENIEGWLSSHKLLGTLIVSVMNLIQALPDPGEEAGFGHIGTMLLGIGGIGCASYAWTMTRTSA